MAIRWSIFFVVIVSLVAQAQKPPAQAPPCPASPASGAKPGQSGVAIQPGEQGKAGDKPPTGECGQSPAPKEPSTSERFPFPGEPSAPTPAGSSSQAPESP